MNLTPVETWLQAHAGLESASLGPGTVARVARERITETRCGGVEEYLARLATDPAERQVLVDRVIVPETWFFRDRAALDALAQHVAGTWGPAHPGGTFRALCVPCSTGEEPYSLAMALALVGWPLARTRIEAVDISRASLGRAQEGVYGSNSFRGGDTAFRDAFMMPAARDTWRVTDAVRAPVSFEVGNLLADDFTAPRGIYDAVLCRNLLIYFSRATQDRAIRTLDRLLAPGGWLAVGPAEPVLLFEHGFAALRVSGGFLLHKPAPVAAPAPIPPPRRVLFTSPPPPVKKIPPRAAAPAPVEFAATLETLQLLADTGRLREATELGEKLLGRDGGSPALLFLLAVVAEAAGDARRAEEFLRKTLYLEPRHAEALAHLALLAEKNGDARGARALRQRAHRAMEKEAV